MTKGMVAAPHRLAAEAGAAILRDGGNAIDAAIAANAVLCVVYPHMTSIGGDLFAMVWPHDAPRPVGLAGAGRAGSRASVEAVRERGHDSMPATGILTVTVPGTVDAWGRLIELYGTLGLAPVLEPAASLARDGFPVTDGLAAALLENAPWLSREPEAARLLPPLKAGMVLRNPELGETLAEIGRSGLNTFYRGSIARAIVEAMERRDGLIEASDLALHRAQWQEPLSTAYRDLTVFELPPPTQGLAALGMLVRLARLDSARLAPGPDFVLELKRVRDEVYPLRDRHITDPEFHQVSEEVFLGPGAAGAGEADALPEGDTVYLCAADQEGNLVSLIQSVANSFGSGVFVEGTGILLHNRGCYFSLDPAHVNRLEPGKRTMHTLIPAIAARQGRPWAAFGSMGADGQPQIQVQVLIGLADLGLDPQSAVAAPRARVRPGGREIAVEADYPGAAALLRMEASVRLTAPRSSEMGHAQALVIDGPGRWRGGADPRADGWVAEA